MPKKTLKELIADVSSSSSIKWAGKGTTCYSGTGKVSTLPFSPGHTCSNLSLNGWFIEYNSEKKLIGTSSCQKDNTVSVWQEKCFCKVIEYVGGSTILFFYRY